MREDNEMSAKHTPETWVHESSRWVHDKNGRLIAIVYGVPLEKAINRARLITAAPELLKFCEWSMKVFCGDSGTGRSHWEKFPEFLAGESAIAKATGA